MSAPDEQWVILYPRDPAHRLRARHLGAFLDRLVERLVALGDGARGRVEAGSYACEVEDLPDLLEAVDVARGLARGREDLRVSLEGPGRDLLARFLGQRQVRLELRAFVSAQPLSEEEACACWCLILRGVGPSGVGERFVAEDRRFAGSPFFEALQGVARTPLAELHVWRSGLLGAKP